MADSCGDNKLEPLASPHVFEQNGPSNESLLKLLIAAGIRIVKGRGHKLADLYVYRRGCWR